MEALLLLAPPLATLGFLEHGAKHFGRFEALARLLRQQLRDDGREEGREVRISLVQGLRLKVELRLNGACRVVPAKRILAR